MPESTGLPSTVTSAGTVGSPIRSPGPRCQPATSASRPRARAASASGSTSESSVAWGARHRLRTSTHTGAITTTAIRQPDQHAALDVRDDHPPPGSRRRARGGEGGQGRGGHRGRDRAGGRRYAPRRGVRSDHPRRRRPSGRPAPVAPVPAGRVGGRNLPRRDGAAGWLLTRRPTRRGTEPVDELVLLTSIEEDHQRGRCRHGRPRRDRHHDDGRRHAGPRSRAIAGRDRFGPTADCSGMHRLSDRLTPIPGPAGARVRSGRGSSRRSAGGLGHQSATRRRCAPASDRPGWPAAPTCLRAPTPRQDDPACARPATTVPVHPDAGWRCVERSEHPGFRPPRRAPAPADAARCRGSQEVLLDLVAGQPLPLASVTFHQSGSVTTGPMPSSSLRDRHGGAARSAVRRRWRRWRHGPGRGAGC